MQIFRLSTSRMKINQIPYVTFQATSQFSLNFALPYSVMTHNSSGTLRFGQKEPIKVQIFRLLCALMKVHPILHANFETTRFIQM